MGFRSYVWFAFGVAASHQQQQQQEPLQQQEKKVAFITSFSMGFRSYIRHFWGSNSELFRPSLPWEFAAGSGSLLGAAASHQQQQQEKNVAKKIIIFYGFQKLR